MSSIDRSEFRFWVKAEFIDDLVQQIQKHLPIHSFQGSESTSEISSIYLDSNDLEAYRNRLISSDSSHLIRLRWYGAYKDGPIFVENKKKQVHFKRLKERFALDPTDVDDFLQGILSCKKIADYEINNPESSYAGTLCFQIKRLIVTKGLYPHLHVQYLRQAFQFPEDSRVRLTLDTQIEMRAAEDFPDVNLETHVYRFPFAILEVKLQDTEPEWIKIILQRPDIITRYPDFSKFIHGMAVICRTDQLSLPIPSWPLLWPNESS